MWNEFEFDAGDNWSRGERRATLASGFAPYDAVFTDF